jgi:hypothetical protein
LGTGLDGAPGVNLNTNVKERPEERLRRLQLFGGATIAPPDTDTLTSFLPELYNPMLDAKCFNDKYIVPTINKQELYADYKKIFDWGLTNPSGSPLFANSGKVTANRFPGMCLRMSFHDNTIVTGDGAAYVQNNIDQVTGKWTGPEMIMETSGGDASVLTCKHERFHPNNNYDQTAARVLHAFQSKGAFPSGPGIGNGQSLMSKYQFSYADALHNCALAALRYMAEKKDANSPDLKITIDASKLADVMNAIDTMKFGRKDACYITDDQTVLSSDDLSANSRRPLCGPSDELPGLNLDARGVNEWFESRNMPVGVWLSLFGTHTALDNFNDPTVIRNFGVPDKDYFVDFVGCPFHTLRAPVIDPGDGGCDFVPTCKNPANIQLQPWPLVQSDCAASIDRIEKDASDLTDLQAQMHTYTLNPGAWIPDAICALGHLGGNNESCTGPFSVSAPKKSMFGSFYKNDYPIPPSVVKCDFKCPVNSSPSAGVTCVQSWNNCTCNSGWTPQGEGCIQKCDFKCPVNSSPRAGVTCVQSWNNCTCNSGWTPQGEGCIQKCDFKCPVNSSPRAGVTCVQSSNNCTCNSGWTPQGEGCIQQCNFKCPVNSSPRVGVKCMLSFNDCMCSSGWTAQGQGCIQQPTDKYKQCKASGYSDFYCNFFFGSQSNQSSGWWFWRYH